MDTVVFGFHIKISEVLGNRLVNINFWDVNVFAIPDFLLIIVNIRVLKAICFTGTG